MPSLNGKESEFNYEVNKKIPHYGDTNYEKEKIRINPKKGDVVNTIIHEKLHANYPDMPHDEVYKNADKIESSMTLPEMAQQLMEVHQRSQNPQYKRQWTYTEASKVREQRIK